VVDDDAACNVLVVLVKAHGVNEDGRLHQEVGLFMLGSQQYDAGPNNGARSPP
jgi:hypothetical protein